MTRRTGLQFPNRLEFPIWERIGKQISLISDSSAWWLGDWLIYGEKEYADRYRMAIEQTSLDYQTLRNYAWVARRFSLSRRRDKLSFAHHAEVAALSQTDQDLWLQRAEHFGWSRNRLRRELRRAAGAGEVVEAAEAVDSRKANGGAVDVKVKLTSSREQLDRWKLAAELQNSDLVSWMVQALESNAKEVIGNKTPESEAPVAERT
ncbi:LmbU family transcriptional regulator [Nonomuraea sp. SYSU D8015]|uniref:LmbU family transcriptional regulator n=1 Tax=Nonomuraea sp. SYSU D8015 TaxID=2593644 RepID=UPI0022DE7ACA|nr:LmbU family transcriptional regulator [Nonomuraea sp. SYSU D8015]